MEGRVRGNDSGDTNVEYSNEKVNVRFKTLLAYDCVTTAASPNPTLHFYPSLKICVTCI